MDKCLLKKVALVTGGTRGIGKAIVEQFIKEGASVAFFGTNETLGKEVAETISSHLEADQKSVFYQVDVGNCHAVEEAIAQVCRDFGPIDILVNNAGITRDNLLMKVSEEDWDEVININLKSVYNTCHAVIRSMIKARSGKIINITSISGLVGNAGQTNYSASKAGMVGFTKSLAKEVGSRNIHVNCIAPGVIETAMSEGIPEEKKKAFMDTIPLKRFGQADEVAYAAVFLASAQSNYITGQVLTIDGGLAMGIG